MFVTSRWAFWRVLIVEKVFGGQLIVPRERRSLSFAAFGCCVRDDRVWGAFGCSVPDEGRERKSLHSSSSRPGSRTSVSRGIWVSREPRSLSYAACGCCVRDDRGGGACCSVRDDVGEGPLATPSGMTGVVGRQSRSLRDDVVAR